MKALTLNEVVSYLKDHDHYVILTHRRPDGDTVGSAAALCRGLRAWGKHAALWENEQFTPKLRPFVNGMTTDVLDENATIISVDIAAKGLFPTNGTEFVNHVELLIDHHGRNEGFAERGYVDSGAAACGEIILELLTLMEIQPDKETADALYLAISTDTGCFRFSNTTADTLFYASACKRWGADTFSINRNFFMTKSPVRLKLDAYLGETTEFYADGKIAVSMIPGDVRDKLGVTPDDIDDISGFGREIEGVEIAVMIREEPEGGKISVRTSPQYDASTICGCLGGGGHKAAAGATVPGGVEAAKKAVLSVLEGMELSNGERYLDRQ